MKRAILGYRSGGPDVNQLILIGRWILRVRRLGRALRSSRRVTGVIQAHHIGGASLADCARHGERDLRIYTGMLYLNVAQDSANAFGPSPLGSCNSPRGRHRDTIEHRVTRSR